ncbi:MAG: helix-turn-helix transcriptional regulator [Actinomycetota bacterium]
MPSDGASTASTNRSTKEAAVSLALALARPQPTMAAPARDGAGPAGEGAGPVAGPLDAAADVIANDGRAIVIAGAAGAGRSTALRTIADRALELGRFVVGVSPDGSFAVVRRPDGRPPRVLSIDADEVRIAATRLLAWSDPLGPLLVLDDLHDLPESTAAAIRSILQAAGHRVSVAVALRDHIGCLGEVGRLLDDIATMLRPQQHRVTDWTTAEVVEWSREHLPAPLLPSAAAAVTDWAAGRAGWVAFILGAIADRLLVVDGDHLTIDGDLDAVAEIIAAPTSSRIGHVGDVRWRIASLVAVAGPLDRSDVEAMIGPSASRSEIAAAVSGLLADAILIHDAGHLALVNPAVKNVLRRLTGTVDGAELARLVIDRFSDDAATSDRLRVAARLLVEEPVWCDRLIESARSVGDRLGALECDLASRIADRLRRAGHATAAFAIDALARPDPDDVHRIDAGADMDLSPDWIARWARGLRTLHEALHPDLVDRIESLADRHDHRGLHHEVSRLAALSSEHERAMTAARKADGARRCDIDSELVCRVDRAVWVGDEPTMRDLPMLAEAAVDTRVLVLAELAHRHLASGHVAEANAVLGHLARLRPDRTWAMRGDALSRLAAVMSGLGPPPAEQRSRPSSRGAAHVEAVTHTMLERRRREQVCGSPLAMASSAAPDVHGLCDLSHLLDVTDREATIDDVERMLGDGWLDAAAHGLVDLVERGVVDAGALERETLRRFEGTWLEPLLDDLVGDPAVSEDAYWKLHPFDREIALLVASGSTNAEVAIALCISLNTVSNRLKRVYRAMGVHSRTELSRRLPSRAFAG